MRTLSARDVKYGFGRLIDLARAAPVPLAKYGRPVVVVLSVEEYERLKALDMGNQASWHGGAEAKRGGRPLERMDKQSLTERDIYTKFITPAVREDTRDQLLDSLLHEALLADDALAERSTQFDWLPVGRHD